MLTLKLKRGSSFCPQCGSSNGNRALRCKGCGQELAAAGRTKRPKVEPALAFDANVTRVIPKSQESPTGPIAKAISVRVRPQGPDYRCFVTADSEGVWKCTNKDCQIAQLGRARSTVTTALSKDLSSSKCLIIIAA